ncbi:flagellar basal body rod protein FlgC [Aquidulcibacter sp.]|jgi:flagellar basal-body rod protein FlgC|uniref:flagellar basal body rod protein FlgC n=1 Tax=Aquidulcibacter sp. TaxID=2052990 RepID=UPI00078E63EB|nr:flagellar basal body rod protein FlgC [Aquidulcibacter sp.]AMS29604.1 flagellar basal-body rod protein FlgC [Hyphomonadaceae bacterium UKL13-1]MCE2891851.1 flagellar basal body rod protein FlgC [Hyphomonadaceae bacterium]OYU52780.1 MAG: flagellar basal body rod protein FlgC [Alphaproteobacteria bacterium PA1]MCZ8209847.1 flagellar basal body rod protein FlgC [Aquidulcibacter sp.]HCP66185.1 flagellar basal body rod protein FlgC [Hyphomonadaceae bacterium]
MTDMNAALNVAASGLRAQTARMKVIAENIANANSTAPNPGADPYQRKVSVFGQVLNRENGTTEVKMTKVQKDTSDFRLRYDPTHPGANAEGYVKLPNVNTLIESLDMREAQRAYEANLNVVESARAMMSRTLDLLRR